MAPQPQEAQAQAQPKESNVTVVVRIRPRSSKEIRDNSAVVVTTTASRKELVLRAAGDAAPSMSGLAQPTAGVPAKSYSFDRVFGPDVAQDTVFDEVVSGMLAEVLLGFNCTIFAYGQTGTGKTYTMEGDLASARGPHAGIIPRTLLSLFDTLEQETAEYSVRVSFTELYNEELKDLLSPEDDPRKLKVFEDLNRKGSVVIQGLEEFIVKSAADVISILQLGSNRRQTAATKMNQVSSRSHAIFSITVHTKECTPDGEELLKVGKLNLVDLAGSENIGRSGAENKRAKEAGMINQSLLTLGRVINALVERSPHIPYRESKLTRILQDSLGGRTKTCIIAAISPARCNIEETLSTLDYAHRAKNIRNKPEANQRMTKKALIREYINEIERLKADLAATREKNGVFMSKENYHVLVDESQSRKDRIDEMALTITAKEERLAAVEEAFRRNTDILHTTSSQLTDAQAELDTKKQELDSVITDMQQLHLRLMEQEHLIRAHAHTETQLDVVAGTLVATLKSSVRDVEGLHDKLDRKRSLEQENMQLFTDLQERVGSHLEGVETRVSAFGSQLDSFQTRVSACFGDVIESSRRHLAAVRESVAAGSHTLASSQDSVEASSCQVVQATESTATQITDTANAIESAFSAHESALLDMLSGLCSQLVVAVDHQKQQLDGIRSGLRDDADALTRDMCGALTSALSARQANRCETQGKLETQVRELREERDALRQQIVSDLEHVEAAKAECLARITGSLDALVGSVSSRVRDRSNTLVDKVAARADTVEAIATSINQHHHAETQLFDEIGVFAGRGSDMAESRYTELDKVATSHAASINDIVSRIEPCTRDVSTPARADLAARKDAIVSCVETGVQSIATSIASQREQLSHQRRVARSMLADVDTTVTTAESVSTDHHTRITSLITESTQSTTQSITDIQTNLTDMRIVLDQTGIRTDIPTGKTPRRRVIRYPTSWTRTRDHDALIAEFRADPQRSQAVFDTPVAASDFNFCVMGGSVYCGDGVPTLTPSSSSTSVDTVDCDAIKDTEPIPVEADIDIDNDVLKTTPISSSSSSSSINTLSGVDDKCVGVSADTSKLPRVRPRRGVTGGHSVAFRDGCDR